LPDQPDSTTRFRYVALGSPDARASALSPMPAVWQVYVLQFVGLQGATLRRATYGARTEWRAPAPAGATGTFEVESAVQRGVQGANAIDAWFFASEAQLAWRSAPLRPTVLVGHDRASGDKSGTDATSGAFTALYASAHSHGGIADVLGRGNLAEWRIGATLDLLPAWRLQWISRSFSRLELGDGVYTKQNALFRAAGGSTSREVGAEHDVETTVRLGRHVRLQAGFAAVNPGEFLRMTGAGATPIRFAYGTTTFIF
jgi:hypothetical protein